MKVAGVWGFPDQLWCIVTPGAVSRTVLPSKGVAHHQLSYFCTFLSISSECCKNHGEKNPLWLDAEKCIAPEALNDSLVTRKEVFNC